MAGRKITLDEEGISEILVADTDSESGSEASDFENNFEEEEEEEDQQHHHHQQQASVIIETQAATGGGLPTWGPPQGRNTNIHPFVGPAKGVKKSEAPHQQRQLTTVCVDVFHRNFSSVG